MTPLAIVAAAYLTSLAVLVLMAMRAPEGWEDASGFHFGADPRLKFHSIHNEAE